jgi:hypothetical protein
MIIKDLFSVLDSNTIIEIVNKKETYKETNQVPEELLNKEIKNIKIEKDKAIIVLDEKTNGKNLEDLGYSFEVGI